jgi:hypothetical protein
MRRIRLRTLLGLNRTGLVAAALISLPAVAYAAPDLAPWGWHGDVGQYEVYAETPPSPALLSDIQRAERLLAASPIDDPKARPTVYLTDGGWRWAFYSARSGGFAVTRTLTATSIFNRSDIVGDRIYTADGRARSLSGVVAHETVHLLQRRRLGFVAFARMPMWVREGYADHVAQESSLDDSAVDRLRAAGRSNDSAIFYREARLRVERDLAGGMSVDTLLRQRGQSIG